MKKMKTIIHIAITSLMIYAAWEAYHNGNFMRAGLNLLRSVLRIF